ncbi:hypothetical protein EFS57_07520, partial [Leuconostoc falkenbergense]|nr:hypothetical protein [Leuconostoc falkenbergense]
TSHESQFLYGCFRQLPLKALRLFYSSVRLILAIYRYYLSGPDTGRVWFDLEDYTGSNPLKGKTFDYKTANPATTKILSELMELEVK